MTLTQEERTKFASYLEIQAKSGRGIVEQMEALGGIHKVMVDRIKAECAAEEIVAAKLRSTADF